MGNLSVDTNLREQLLSTNKFGIMEQEVDEDEHSGEMQYPFIAKVINDVKMENNGSSNNSRGNSGNNEGRSRCSSTIKILPIMIGAIKGNKEEAFGRLLSPYLSDRAVFTVISSDFCHCKLIFMLC